MCLGGGDPPKLKPLTPPPTKNDADVEMALQRQREADRMKRGRLSTMVTGAQGLTGDAGTKKTLLGQ